MKRKLAVNKFFEDLMKALNEAIEYTKGTGEGESTAYTVPQKQGSENVEFNQEPHPVSS